MQEPTRMQDMEAPLAELTDRFEWRDDNRLDVFITSDRLLPAVEVLFAHHWVYLTAITGFDSPAAEGSEAEGMIELLYHFCSGASILTLRLSLPYSNLVVPSVCHLIPPATLYERELIEMLGVEIPGTTSTDRLLLPDDWPVGVYPMRKTFKGL